MEKLDRTQKGEVRKTTSNIMLILENDPEIKNKIVLDEFASRGMAMGALPWNGDTEPRLWTDVDSAGMRDYLENRYDVTGINKVEDALSLIAFKHRINQVADYLYKNCPHLPEGELTKLRAALEKAGADMAVCAVEDVDEAGAPLSPPVLTVPEEAGVFEGKELLARFFGPASTCYTVAWN